MDFDFDYAPPSYEDGVGALRTSNVDADHRVEIARVSLDSTLGDDYVVYAKQMSEGIEYSVEGEYESLSVEQPVRGKPLSMAELIQLIDTAHNDDMDIVGL